jgi:hypothetical protein
LPELPAERLRAVLLSAGDNFDPTGLSIYGVRITGALRLDDFKLDFPLQFGFVHFDDAVSMTMTRGPFIAVLDSFLVRGADFSHAELTQGLSLRGTESSAHVLVNHASLGVLDADGIRLRARSATGEAPALSLHRTRISGDCNLEKSELRGGLVAVGLRTDGHVSLSKAVLVSCCDDEKCKEDSHAAVRLDGARIGSGLFLNNATIRGRNMVLHAEIGGAVEAQCVTASARGLESETLICFSGSTVSGNFVFSRISAEGAIDLSGVKADNLWLDDSTIQAGATRAVDLTTASIARDVSLTRAVVDGEIHGGRGTFGGLFEMNEIQVTGKLNLANATIGSFSATHVRIGQLMRAKDADGRPDATGPRSAVKALDLDRTIINGYARFQFADVSGHVSLSGATVRGPLILGSAHSRLARETSAEASPVRVAVRGDIVLDNIHAIGGIELSADFPLGVDGNVIATHASISGMLDLGNLAISGSERAVFNATSPLRVPADIEHAAVHAVNLRASRVDHLRLSMSAGKINLDGATIGHLEVVAIKSLSAASRRPRRVATAFKNAVAGHVLREPTTAYSLPSIEGTREITVSRLSGIPDGDWRIVKGWLADSQRSDAGAGKFYSQPWLELAHAFETAGDQQGARWLRFEATDRLMKYRKDLLSPTWRLVTRTTVGFGYRPGRALVCLVILWGVAFGIGNAFADSFVPSDRTVALSSAAAGKPVNGSDDPVPIPQPRFNSGLYALDVVAPAVNTGQAEAWRVTTEPWLAVALAALRIFSWALLGLFITGAAGLFKAK